MELTTELKQKFNIPDGCKYDGGVDLISENFEEFELKRIQHSISLFGIDYVAGKSLKKIASMIDNPLSIFDENIINLERLIPLIGHDKASKFIDGINNHRTNGIKLERIIRATCYNIENLGKRTSTEFAKYLSNVEYDFSGLERKVIDQLMDSVSEINDQLLMLNELDVKILYEESKTNTNSDEMIVSFVLTGSPKEFGFKTKAEFMKILPSNWKEVSKLSTDTTYLITDDLTSSSSKMKTAKKLGIQIKTYGEISNN